MHDTPTNRIHSYKSAEVSKDKTPPRDTPTTYKIHPQKSDEEIEDIWSTKLTKHDVEPRGYDKDIMRDKKPLDDTHTAKVRPYKSDGTPKDKTHSHIIATDKTYLHEPDGAYRNKTHPRDTSIDKTHPHESDEKIEVYSYFVIQVIRAYVTYPS